jgi:hypothetical protein
VGAEEPLERVPSPLAVCARECRIQGQCQLVCQALLDTPRCALHDHHESRLYVLRAGRPARAATLAAQSARGRSGALGRDRWRPAQNEGGIFRREMPVSAPAGLGMKLQAKGADDFQDGGEIRITLAGERLVKAFARQPGILCDL